MKRTFLLVLTAFAALSSACNRTPRRELPPVPVVAATLTVAVMVLASTTWTSVSASSVETTFSTPRVRA